MAFTKRNSWWAGLDQLNITGTLAGYITGVYPTEDGSSVGVGMVLTADGTKWYKKSQNVPLNNPKISFLPKTLLKCIGISPASVDDAAEYILRTARTAPEQLCRAISVTVTQRGAYYNISNWKPKNELLDAGESFSDGLPTELPTVTTPVKPAQPVKKAEISEKTTEAAYHKTEATEKVTDRSVLSYIPVMILVDYLRSKGWTCELKTFDDIDPDDLPFD